MLQIIRLTQHLILIFILFCSILIGKSSTGWATRYELFSLSNNRSYAHEDYDNIVQNLQKNDELVFSDGRVFILDGFNKKGSQNLVLGIKDQPNIVLRIPLKISHRISLGHYYSGYSTLETHHLPVPKIFMDDFRKGEYLVTEKIRGELISFYQFLSELLVYRRSLDNPVISTTKMGKYSIHYFNELSEQFLALCDRLAHFNFIGDLTSLNLVYSFEKKKWVILDWSDGHDSYIQNQRYGQNRVLNPAKHETPLNMLFDDFFLFFENQILAKTNDKYLNEFANLALDRIFKARQSLPMMCGPIF